MIYVAAKSSGNDSSKETALVTGRITFNNDCNTLLLPSHLEEPAKTPT